MLLQFKNIYQHKQSIIILVAIPGCGKSTLANYIGNIDTYFLNAYDIHAFKFAEMLFDFSNVVKNSVNSSHLEWASVNQDVYKSRGRTLGNSSINEKKLKM